MAGIVHLGSKERQAEHHKQYLKYLFATVSTNLLGQIMLCTTTLTLFILNVVLQIYQARGPGRLSLQTLLKIKCSMMIQTMFS